MKTCIFQDTHATSSELLCYIVNMVTGITCQFIALESCFEGIKQGFCRLSLLLYRFLYHYHHHNYHSQSQHTGGSSYNMLLHTNIATHIQTHMLMQTQILSFLPPTLTLFFPPPSHPLYACLVYFSFFLIPIHLPSESLRASLVPFSYSPSLVIYHSVTWR